MTVSNIEVALWREHFLADRKAASLALSQLYETDQEAFLTICRQLAWDSNEVIRANALRQLGYHGQENDQEGERAAVDALTSEHKEVREAALLALGTIATAQSFPTIFSWAKSGSDVALRASAKQAKTPEQQEEVLQLARTELLYPASEMMVFTAVWVLRQFSTPERETPLLLEALKVHPNDIIIHALRHADVSILPVLEEMRATFREGTVQFIELSNTIDYLRDKQGSLTQQ